MYPTRGVNVLIKRLQRPHLTLLPCEEIGKKGSLWTSLVAQMVKRLPTMQETQVWFLGWEDSLKKEMATHSSTLAWKIPRTEAAPSMDSQSRTRLSNFTSLHFMNWKGTSPALGTCWDINLELLSLHTCEK